MIKILSVVALAVLCYVVAHALTQTYTTEDRYFMWGWISSIVTGFLVNAYVKLINNDDQKTH